MILFTFYLRGESTHETLGLGRIQVQLITESSPSTTRLVSITLHCAYQSAPPYRPQVRKFTFHWLLEAPAGNKLPRMTRESHKWFTRWPSTDHGHTSHSIPPSPPSSINNNHLTAWESLTPTHRVAPPQNACVVQSCSLRWGFADVQSLK